MEYEKVAIVLSVIAIFVSAGSTVYINSLLSPINERIDSVQESLINIQSRSELFPGEWELYDKAKQEGSIILYTMMDVEHIVSLFRGFSNRYPGIKTSYWQGRSGDVRSRVFLEYEEQQRTVDVIIGGGYPFKSEGVIIDYETVQLDDLIIQNPTLPCVFIYVTCLGYNPTLLAPEDVPTNWEDVVDPKFEGILALRDPQDGSTGSGYIASLYSFWNDPIRYENYLKGIKALNVPVHRSTSTMMNLVIAGEYSIATILFAHDVVINKEQGAPIDFVKTVDPVICSEGNAVIYKLSPNPNAAKLFIEWMLSTEGQNTFAELGRPPNRKGIASKVSLESMYPDATNIMYPPEVYLSDIDDWIEKNITPVWEDQ